LYEDISTLSFDVLLLKLLVLELFEVSLGSQSELIFGTSDVVRGASG
jgi:hypothetical protein